MIFKSSFFGIKGAMNNMSLRVELNKSIKELQANLQQKGNNLQHIKAESEKIIQECLQVRLTRGFQQLKSDRSDIVYRTYFQEGGIYSLLKEIVEYAEYRLDDFNDVNTLFLSIKNGKVDMITYHINKMKKKLDEIDEEMKRLEADISGEEAGTRLNDRDIFLKEIGWEDITVKLKKLNEKLDRIIDEFESASEDSMDALKQKLLLISNELDEVNLKKDIEKLRAAKQALKRDQNNEEVTDYGLLVEKLETVLGDEKLKQLSIVEAAELEAYKEKVREAADFVQQELLNIWNKD
jgi:hypothetical protein